MGYLAKLPETHQAQVVIDAIRCVPNSFDPYQGRVPSYEGSEGDKSYAVKISRETFDQMGKATEALQHPGAWCVIGGFGTVTIDVA